jgi:hypothetical protein
VAFRSCVLGIASDLYPTPVSMFTVFVQVVTAWTHLVCAVSAAVAVGTRSDLRTRVTVFKRAKFPVMTVHVMLSVLPNDCAVRDVRYVDLLGATCVPIAAGDATLPAKSLSAYRLVRTR